jgi:hypothetical protein
MAWVLGQSIPDTVANQVARNSCLGCSAYTDKHSTITNKKKENIFFMAFFYEVFFAQFGDKGTKNLTYTQDIHHFSVHFAS